MEGRRNNLRAGLEASDDESSRAEVRGLKVAGAKFETQEVWNLEIRLAATERRSARVVGDLRRSCVILLFRYANYYWTVGHCGGSEEGLARRVTERRKI